MLDRRFGIHVIVHLGQTLPAQPPPSLLSSLLSVEVQADESGLSGFQITFSLGDRGAADPRSGGPLDIFNRARIGVRAGFVPDMLLDGVITNHEVTPGSRGAAGTLTVTGADLSVLFDLEERDADYGNQRDSVIATRLLSQYSQLGLVPEISQTDEQPAIVQRVPQQTATDFRYLLDLAQRNSFVFFIEPAAFGVSRAYFGPPKRGPRAPAMQYNLGAGDNVTSLRASADGLAPVDVEATFFDVSSPDRTLRRIPPSRSQDERRARSPFPSRRKAILRTSASLTESLVRRIAAAGIESAADPVVLEGEVDALRYGGVLRPRSVVSVGGAGGGYDGDYLVRRVTHTLQQGSYTQSFTLGREGTGSTRSVAA